MLVATVRRAPETELIHTLYIERGVADHPLAKRVAERFADAVRVPCERYTEVFNPRSQSFRLQKRRPALVLARKFDNFVLATPPDYGIGGENNYYFSHMMNCLYDCRYCFLQGMYRSAHYVVFVNYADFAAALDARLAAHPGADVWFFSGYDCDSLAFEPVTGFVEHFLPFFAQRPRAQLEIRTKSTQIRTLLATPPLPNVVVACSLTPSATAARLEHRVPSVARRIEAMAALAERGWRIGLRFDPLILEADFESHYRGLFDQVFSRIPRRAVHSVTLGSFRMPREYFRNALRQYPEEPLFAGPLTNSEGTVSYGPARDRDMVAFCAELLERYIAPEQLYSCAPATRRQLEGPVCRAACA